MSYDQTPAKQAYLVIFFLLIFAWYYDGCDHFGCLSQIVEPALSISLASLQGNGTWQVAVSFWFCGFYEMEISNDIHCAQLAGFTGVDDPYERPLNCEVQWSELFFFFFLRRMIWGLSYSSMVFILFSAPLTLNFHLCWFENHNQLNPNWIPGYMYKWEVVIFLEVMKLIRWYWGVIGLVIRLMSHYLEVVTCGIENPL